MTPRITMGTLAHVLRQTRAELRRVHCLGKYWQAEVWQYGADGVARHRATATGDDMASAIWSALSGPPTRTSASAIPPTA